MQSLPTAELTMNNKVTDGSLDIPARVGISSPGLSSSSSCLTAGAVEAET